MISSEQEPAAHGIARRRASFFGWLNKAESPPLRTISDPPPSETARMQTSAPRSPTRKAAGTVLAIVLCILVIVLALLVALAMSPLCSVTRRERNRWQHCRFVRRRARRHRVRGGESVGRLDALLDATPPPGA